MEYIYNFIIRIMVHYSVYGKVYRKLKKFHNAGRLKKLWITSSLEKYHIYLDHRNTIGENLWFPHPHNIQIGKGVVIKNNVTIYHNVTLGQVNDQYPTIEDNVVIYPNVCVLGNITVGRNSIIRAGSIVEKDIPPFSIVAGNPSMIIRVIEKDEK